MKNERKRIKKLRSKPWTRYSNLGRPNRSGRTHNHDTGRVKSYPASYKPHRPKIRDREVNQYEGS